MGSRDAGRGGARAREVPWGPPGTTENRRTGEPHPRIAFKTSSNRPIWLANTGSPLTFVEQYEYMTVWIWVCPLTMLKNTINYYKFKLLTDWLLWECEMKLKCLSWNTDSRHTAFGGSKFKEFTYKISKCVSSPNRKKRLVDTRIHSSIFRYLKIRVFVKSLDYYSFFLLRSLENLKYMIQFPADIRAIQ